MSNPYHKGYLDSRTLKLWDHFSENREKVSPYIKNVIDEGLDFQHCTFHEKGYFV